MFFCSALMTKGGGKGGERHNPRLCAANYKFIRDALKERLE
ncbi:hypothetical protein SAMN04515620_1198 [Collimonas sp. OK607]|nr:hypothetical protein SAMN04515620_1198 [Collimonas sp. OK607]